MIFWSILFVGLFAILGLILLGLYALYDCIASCYKI